ncbi:hypothetical protein DPSP01_003289 [Paraphaeosphaeria sporulosa]
MSEVSAQLSVDPSALRFVRRGNNTNQNTRARSKHASSVSFSHPRHPDSLCYACHVACWLGRDCSFALFLSCGTFPFRLHTMDDSLLESDFDDGASSDFAPPAKPAKAIKAKPAAPKKAAAPAKARGRPPKDPSAPPKAKAPAKAKAAPKKKRKDDSDDENSDIDMHDDVVDDDDDSLLADTPPKQKKAPAAKKSSGKPLASIANESFDMMDGIDDSAPSGKAKASGASSKYQMVSILSVHYADPG